MLLQLPGGRPVRGDGKAHIGLFGRSSALFEIAGSTGRGDILPGGFATQPARHDMIEGQVFGPPAILAREMIAQEQVEPRERRILAGPHIFLERDHARNLHRQRGAMHFAFVIFDNIDAIEEHRLDRGLPGPKAQRIIG